MKRQRRLFSKCTFLFNREVPSYCLQFLVLSFGGAFYHQDAYESLADSGDSSAVPKITHHVLDRPIPASHTDKAKREGTELIQPQYILDSLNNLYLLPPGQYTPGAPPPPHLSPFVDGKQEGYMPQREKEIMHLKGEEVIDSESDEDEELVPEDSGDEGEQAKGKAATTGTDTDQKPADGKAAKGDADSSSDDESDENEDMMKRGDLTAEEAQRVKTRKQAANAKLKKDMAQEQRELGKTLISNR